MQEVINTILSWPPGLLTVLGLTLMMYALRFVDALIFRDRIKIAFSIIPRTKFNPFLFLLSPWVHKDKGHLFSNTIPFILLASILALDNLTIFWFATLIIALVDGLGTWIFGSEGRHLGVSGLIMGYLGYILFRGLFNQNDEQVIFAIILLILTRSSLLGNLRLRKGSSNIGHWSGFLGGVGAAYFWSVMLQQPLI